MALIRGAQLADAPLGVTTTKINDGAVTDAKVDGTVLSTNTGNAAPANDYTALGKKIVNVAAGTATTDAVNFGQLQAAIQGFAWKTPCFTGTLDVNGAPEPLQDNPIFAGVPGGPGGTLTANVNGTTLVVGGVQVKNLGQRVVVTSRVGDELQNGIYTLTQKATAGLPWVLTRATDMDINVEVPSAATTIENSNSFAFGRVFVVENPKGPAVGTSFVINSDDIDWVNFPTPVSLIAGNGISISGLTISVDITATPSGSGRGLTFVGNKLAGDIEPNKGLKFDDTTGRFEAYLALTPSVEGGLQFGANGGLAAKLEANQGLSIGPNNGIQTKLETASPTGGGLQIGPNGGIEVLLDSTASGLKYTATGIAVKTKTAVIVTTTGGLSINNVGELQATVDANKGLQISATNVIEVKLEPSTPTTGGLQFNANGGIEAKLNGSGGLDYSATGLTAKLGNPANSAPGLSLSSNGIYNNVQQIEESGAALATAAQGDPVFSALTQTPFKGNGGNATIQFTINGVKYRVGPSAANDPIYYSGDGGVTARALNAIVAGDIPYRGGALGFNTLVSDEVNADYLAAVP
jgi:hypothetical protein